MNRDEMLNFLKNEARGISVMFGPNCETIVHDMTRPGHPILAIFNGTVTGREVGSTADIFGDIGDYDESIYQNKDYINQMVLSRDGRTLKSSTFNIVGEDYHFALGINLDITNMVRAGQMLSELTATSGDLQQTLMQDARSQLEELLRECISAVGKEPEAMKKTDRMRIIRMLYKRRAFTYQKSVAIVAERLNVSRYTVYKYMHELEEAEDFTSAAIALIKRTIRDHRRVIFNGNGYSAEWEEEAARRGLPNKKNTPAALPALIDPKNIALMEEFGVLTKVEMESRYEVEMEHYAKVINIEALTMLEMARKQLLPAVNAYMSEVANTAASKLAVSESISVRSETKTLGRLSADADAMSDAIDTLQDAVDAAKALPSESEKAVAFHDNVLPAMDTLRAAADDAETLCGEDYWPLPSYSKMLYYV